MRQPSASPTASWNGAARNGQNAWLPASMPRSSSVIFAEPACRSASSLNRSVNHRWLIMSWRVANTVPPPPCPSQEPEPESPQSPPDQSCRVPSLLAFMISFVLSIDPSDRPSGLSVEARSRSDRRRPAALGAFGWGSSEVLTRGRSVSRNPPVRKQAGYMEKGRRADYGLRQSRRVRTRGRRDSLGHPCRGDTPAG